MYAVSGRLVDWLGTRRSFLIFVTGWSIANMLHGLARTAAHFTIFRFLLGATEPANFPAGVRGVAEWFPMRERALAVGIFNAGTAIGSALAAPFVGFIALAWGWRWAFVAGGALGLLLRVAVDDDVRVLALGLPGVDAAGLRLVLEGGLHVYLPPWRRLLMRAIYTEAKPLSRGSVEKHRGLP
jgi:MFS family permease